MNGPRIFFDTNEGSPSGYWLHLPKSKADLDALGSSLKEGLEVLIVMPNELEMLAVLRHDAEAKVWVAEPARGTIRYLDGS